MDQQLIAAAVVSITLSLIRRMCPHWSSVAMLRSLVVTSLAFGGLAYSADTDLYSQADTVWAGVWTITGIMLAALGIYEVRRQDETTELLVIDRRDGHDIDAGSLATTGGRAPTGEKPAGSS